MCWLMLHFTQTAVLTQIFVFNGHSWNASNLYTVFSHEKYFYTKWFKQKPQCQHSHSISESKLVNDNTAAYFLQKPLKDIIDSLCIKCLLFYGPIMQLETCCNLLQSTRLEREMISSFFAWWHEETGDCVAMKYHYKSSSNQIYQGLKSLENARCTLTN